MRGRASSTQRRRLNQKSQLPWPSKTRSRLTNSWIARTIPDHKLSPPRTMLHPGTSTRSRLFHSTCVRRTKSLARSPHRLGAEPAMSLRYELHFELQPEPDQFEAMRLCAIAVQMELLPTSIAEKKFFHSVKPRELVGLGTLRALMPGWMDGWTGGSQESLETESCCCETSFSHYQSWPKPSSSNFRWRSGRLMIPQVQRDLCLLCLYSVLTPPSPTIIARANAVKKAMIEIRQLKARRQINEALATRCGFHGIFHGSTLRGTLKTLPAPSRLSTACFQIFSLLLSLSSRKDSTSTLQNLCPGR